MSILETAKKVQNESFRLKFDKIEELANDLFCQNKVALQTNGHNNDTPLCHLPPFLTHKSLSNDTFISLQDEICVERKFGIEIGENESVEGLTKEEFLSQRKVKNIGTIGCTTCICLILETNTKVGLIHLDGSEHQYSEMVPKLRF